MSRTLTALNFTIHPARSFTSARELVETILPDFAARVRPGDLVVVHVSGHGFSYAQNNWIAPLDMPASITLAQLPDAAVSIATVGSTIAAMKPGLVVILSDACRNVARFILRDAAGVNVARPIVEDQRFGMPGMIGYASRIGTPADGFSQAGVPSRFTGALTANLSSTIEFSHVFKNVNGEVALATQPSQEPTLNDWSGAFLYLAPTAETLRELAELWRAALTDPVKQKAVAGFARMYPVSRHAAAARAWLARSSLMRAVAFTRWSPMAIDNAWRRDGARVAVLPDAFTNLAFDRTLAADAVATLSSVSPTSLGVVKGGMAPMRAGAAKVATDAQLAAVYQSLVATDVIAARATPSSAAAVTTQIPRNARLDIQTVTDSGQAKWARATIAGSEDPVYFQLLGDQQLLQPLELGRSLYEVTVPASERTAGAVDREAIERAIAQARALGAVTWVSLATASTDTARVRDLRGMQLSHAQFLLREAGIAGTRITAVEATPTMQENGVRLRFYGN